MTEEAILQAEIAVELFKTGRVGSTDTASVMATQIVRQAKAQFPDSDCGLADGEHFTLPELDILGEALKKALGTEEGMSVLEHLQNVSGENELSLSIYEKLGG